jgi:hypothetical protein
MNYFITKTPLPNYKIHPELYANYKSFKGKDVYSSYIYWILKNNGVQSIKLADNINSCSKEDNVFFHYDNLKYFDISKFNKKIQFVSDKPVVDGCDIYLSNDLSACLEEGREYKFEILPGVCIKRFPDYKFLYFPEPLPVGLKKCNVFHPPRNICCMGLRINLDPEFYKLFQNTKQFIEQYIKNRKIKNKKYLKLLGEFNFKLNDKTNHNYGNEHVFCFMRKEFTPYTLPSVYYKHANRLFISFYTSVPLFIKEEPSILFHKKSNHDFISFKNVYDFLDKLLQFCDNSDIALAMAMHYKQRSNENNESAVVLRYNEINQILKSC